MARRFRDGMHRGLVAGLTSIMVLVTVGLASADDCKRVDNILVLFDASGFMKDKNRYHTLLQQMGFFERAMPLTADGFFNVGIRHYGLKVGMGCENTESILALRPWDPERFMNSFPPTCSYGVSALSAGLRAAADELSSAQGKSVLIIIGGGLESCQSDPIQIAEQICRNYPDLEIHTFQMGSDQAGRFYMAGIAAKCRGSYQSIEAFQSSGPWHAWMKSHLLVPCRTAAPAPTPAAAKIAPVLFDGRSFSIKSKDPNISAGNSATLSAVGKLLKADPAVKAVLHGYSDGKGTPQFELDISRKRGEAVARHLMSSYKIPVSQLSIVAHGAAPPSVQVPGLDAERMARRVEIEIVR